MQRRTIFYSTNGDCVDCWATLVIECNFIICQCFSTVFAVLLLSMKLVSYTFT